jgi:N-acetylglucosaminyldiphosphoundecaprenol N-acetyl-beta-D-mannosaminyltransferase
MTLPSRLRGDVIGSAIDVVSWSEAISIIEAWADRRDSRVVCICNTHSVVTARTDREFHKVISGADMATADGAPVAFMLRRLGHVDQQRINGPDLMWKYCEHAARVGQSMYLYGASEGTLELLRQRLAGSFPDLKIAGAFSPPFRALSVEEDERIVRTINDSGAGVVWVGLGCPKQEMWMASHRGRINAVMIGVGAAFDYHAGTIKRAPLWVQRNGLEWLHRLISEPRRLWRRYLVTNSLFIWFAMKQLISRSGSA